MCIHERKKAASYSFNWRLDESGNSVKIALIRITSHFCVVTKCTSIQLCVRACVYIKRCNYISVNFFFFLSLFMFYFFCCNVNTPQSQCHGINGIHKASQSYCFDLDKKIVDWRSSIFSFLLPHCLFNMLLCVYMILLLEFTKFNQKMHPKKWWATLYVRFNYTHYIWNFQ